MNISDLEKDNSDNKEIKTKDKIAAIDVTEEIDGTAAVNEYKKIDETIGSDPVKESQGIEGIDEVDEFDETEASDTTDELLETNEIKEINESNNRKGTRAAKATKMTKTIKEGNEINDDIDLSTQDGMIAFIEALLFVSKEPLQPEQLMNFLNIADITQFEKIIDVLDEQYRQKDRGFFLKRTGGGLQLATKPVMHDYLKEYFTSKSTSRLTIASLETLAIIAYRQPVTLAEISDLRGVNSTGPIKNLLQKKLIKITGRKKVPGLPALYSTTKEFLLYFGLNNLTELPSLEELTEMFEEKEQPSLFKDL